MKMASRKEPREAEVYQQGIFAGHLREAPEGLWQFCYVAGYEGPSVSLTMPVRSDPYMFKGFPSVFEGLLPEGPQLEVLLRKHKMDRNDLFAQLIAVGEDMVGSLQVRMPIPVPNL